ncbi:MAG TPA: hypothetical protein PK341_03405 [Spirochaetota bacterium]|nr:hypothetical protein [Spirochaetota bacterium]
MRNRNLKWYRLDNAAKIFPSIITGRMTAVFRISVTLKKEVDPPVLQQAVENLMPRFPYFQVTLKRGMFWHYLQQTPSAPLVREERFDPCQKINRHAEKGLLFRVLYFGKKISVEFCHVLTDGTGGVMYLQSLVAEYLRLRGVAVPHDDGIFAQGKTPHPEESEDSFLRYYKDGIPFPQVEPAAFHLAGSLIPQGSLNVCTGIVPSRDILKTARARGVTLTEYLAAVYLYSLQEYVFSLPPGQRRKLLMPIRVMVPVNLRKLYPSKTMRNFFLAVKPGIDPRLGRYTLDEIIKSVYHCMRVEVDEKFINQQIARNVKGESHPLLRAVPLFIKGPVMKLIYNRWATSKHSGVLTNMGVVGMPSKAASHIERFEGLPNPNPLTRINIAVITYGKSTYVSFASFIDDSDVQKIFFRTLRRQGIVARIETN